jgi:NADH dehydrogenase FAD-containing subunit
MLHSDSRIAESERKRPRNDVVVIGCSFGALEFLYRRARRYGRFLPGSCTVVEPSATHMYLPLAHEVASGIARAVDNTYDAAAFVTSIGAAWCPRVAVAVDPVRRVVYLDQGEPLAFSRLVIAVGSVADIPGPIAEWPNLLAAKNAEDAARLYALVAPWHMVAVVGGGITGVEWAAELARRARVVLVTETDEILPALAPGVRRHAARRLARLGVPVETGRQVTARPDADFIVWAGGVRANPMLARCGLPLTRDGHLVVDSHLGVPGHSGIYGIGDAVRPSGDRAIDAIWQGAWLARHFDHRRGEYRAGRRFFYGLSLGRRHSMILRGRWWADTPLFVAFRRWLRGAYYARFTVLSTLFRCWHAFEHALDRGDDLARRARLR